MRIDQIGRPVAQAGSRVRRRQDGFFVSEDAAPEEPAQAAPPTAATNIAAIAANADLERGRPAALDREAAEHGDAMLKTLRRLQLAALGTQDDGARLCLAELAGSLKPAADAGLNAVLQGIAARVAVEVARSG